MSRTARSERLSTSCPSGIACTPTRWPPSGYARQPESSVRGRRVSPDRSHGSPRLRRDETGWKGCGRGGGRGGRAGRSRSAAVARPQQNGHRCAAAPTQCPGGERPRSVGRSYPGRPTAGGGRSCTAGGGLRRRRHRPAGDRSPADRHPARRGHPAGRHRRVRGRGPRRRRGRRCQQPPPARGVPHRAPGVALPLAMTLAVRPPLEPMLARAADDIPVGREWRYEPKWDGFRVIVFRDGDDVVLGSRKGQPLQRFFPEILEPLRATLPAQAVADGEIIIATSRGLDFDALQMRLHPAASRVARLAAETPATVILFDLLADGDQDLRGEPLVTRRERLLGAVTGNARVALTPQTADHDEAAEWFTRYEGAGLDGLIAKPEESTYRSGERGWTKIKHLRTVDCVVGGYRMEVKGGGVGSLLLGLYDEEGVLHHVGHTSSFSAQEKRDLLTLLAPLEGGDSFGHGRTPGAPSRWSRDKDAAWTPLTPSLVCEVSFDHLQGQRFRHAARFLRWRDDRDPLTCTYAQLTPADAFRLADIVTLPDAGP